MNAVCLAVLLLVMSLSGFMLCRDTALMLYKPSLERAKDICFSGVVFVFCVFAISYLVLLTNSGGL